MEKAPRRVLFSGIGALLATLGGAGILIWRDGSNPIFLLLPLLALGLILTFNYLLIARHQVALRIRSRFFELDFRRLPPKR
jgi:hypothetical protein